MSQTDLIRKTNGAVAHSSIGRWMRGEERPSVEFLDRIAQPLGATHGEMIIAAGYSTAEKLGIVATEPVGNPRFTALVRDLNRELARGSVSDEEEDMLVSAIVDQTRRTLKLWREMRGSSGRR